MAELVHATCPGCKKSLRVPSGWAGRKVSCKHCGAVLTVPGASVPVAPITPAQAKPTAEPSRVKSDTPAPPEPEAIIRTSVSLPRRRFPAFLYPVIGLGLLALAAAGVAHFAGIFPLANDHASGTKSPAPPTGKTSIPVAKPPEQTSPAATGPIMPRRLLAICASNYLYAERVSPGGFGASFGDLVSRLARTFQIDSSQVVILSDALISMHDHAPPVEDDEPGVIRRKRPGSKTPAPFSRDAQSSERSASRPMQPPPSNTIERVPPTRPVLEKVITDFLTSSRPQDRIVILFVGHIVVADGKAYMATLESDFSDTDTLVPLSWLWDKLTESKARQKIVIFDTCRLDPTAGYEFTGSGPMPAELEAALTKPPKGIQVWASCKTDQFSYVHGDQSLFLRQVATALESNKAISASKPEEALPLEQLRTAVDAGVGEAAKKEFKSDQTPISAGEMLADGAAYDPDQAPPARMLVTAPKPAADAASHAEVQQILEELALPPFRVSSGEDQPLVLDGVVTFSAEKLAPYKPDYTSLAQVRAQAAKKPLRGAVLDTLDLLRRVGQPSRTGEGFRDFYPAKAPANLKDRVRREQERPAKLMASLNEAREHLDKIAEERGEEPSKRWQAHFDYVRAQLLARMAFLEEYDLMLGKIRKDELPELDKGTQAGWRLVAREKMQGGKEVRDLANQARKLFAKIATNHAGTPWEVLARRAAHTSLGLEWRGSDK